MPPGWTSARPEVHAKIMLDSPLFPMKHLHIPSLLDTLAAAGLLSRDHVGRGPGGRHIARQADTGCGAGADVSSTDGGFRSVLYVTNWGIYGAGFLPSAIPVSEITHVQYAFADIKEDGSVVSSDEYADTQKAFADSGGGGSSSGTKDAHGMVEQLYRLKQENRHLKVLLSVGGFKWSPKFAPVAADATKRATFVSTAVKLMGDWGMDGLDIDWEYPDTAAANADSVKLLADLRKGLDDYAAKNTASGSDGNYRFTLSFPAPAGPASYQAFDFKAMDASLDFWSVMAFDFAGNWDNTTGHQANVFPDPSQPLATKASIDRAVADYVAAGVSPAKINVGLPLYGRSFDKTAGLGMPYTPSTAGSFEGQAAIWLYRDLPRQGATVLYDDVAKASYTFDSSTGQLITYDDDRSGQYKARYIREKGLGGVMFWEASQDRNDSGSLVRSMTGWLEKLQCSQNLLSYPASQYENIRTNMGKGSA
ncbi:chitinase 1 [Magnaporthiopsis poae ATCC 64411]|uniref:chitinase n=1 Tax=Magnaporthiopsis poae (strain ATCC 64411 / 73-15) TaxID=644358 RepID=A0A0C4DXN4_MAGP6|nr:chitinase 1 [Magnaporthiopsis poae ATCC 64411]